MKKDKKKGTSKKTWVVDCRTDCAFDFAMKVLHEAENEKHPLALRCNFVKIAYMNSCETIAKAQADPQGLKLELAFKLFTKNLNQICKVSDLLWREVHSNTHYANEKIYRREVLENPFDYIDVDYNNIEFALKRGKTKTIQRLPLSTFIARYHYPMIYEEVIYSPENHSKIEATLLPTNDIKIVLPPTFRYVCEYAERSSELYIDSDELLDKADTFFSFIKDPEFVNSPHPQLIHVPNDSFLNISELVQFAAENPKTVDEICFTAYRLGKDNSMIESVITATKNKIPCKVFIELSARGEIDKGIAYLEKLIKEANQDYLDIKVSYNGIKVHAKMILIKLKGGHSIGVFSTGNYNESTAMIYKDYHYISCEENVTDMIQRNFSILWNSHQPVLSSISNILSKEIYEEIAKGAAGRIWIQANHLDNKHIVTLLKEAINRGCNVKLIIRTTKGFHNREMKNCKTVVGKYLEHSRVYIFGNDHSCRVYLSSSDILFRNLYNRFESYVKISDTDIQSRLINDFRDLYKNGQK